MLYVHVHRMFGDQCASCVWCCVHCVMCDWCYLYIVVVSCVCAIVSCCACPCDLCEQKYSFLVYMAVSGRYTLFLD